MSRLIGSAGCSSTVTASAVVVVSLTLAEGIGDHVGGTILETTGGTVVSALAVELGGITKGTALAEVCVAIATVNIAHHETNLTGQFGGGGELSGLQFANFGF